MSDLILRRGILLFIFGALLAGCALPGTPFGAAPTPTSEPTPVPPTAEPTATPVAVDTPLQIDQMGLSLSYPSGWQTREMSQTLTLAATDAALDANEPGEQLVVLIGSSPLRALAEQNPQVDTTDLQALFDVYRDIPEQAGYTLSEPEPITLDGQSGLSASLEAGNGAGRLVVISAPPQVVQVLGQASPDAWEEQQAIFDEILNSMTFFVPSDAATPEPEDMAAQPVRVTEGPPGFVLRLGGNEGTIDGRFALTRGIAAAPDGTLYVAESARGIWVFAADGTLQRTFGRDELLDAFDVALNSEGDLFVADYGSNAIVRFSPNGEEVLRWGQTGDQPEQFGLLSPQRIAIGPDDGVYALDSRVNDETGNAVNSVIHFTDEGEFVERIELPPGSAPNDLALDEDGLLYLADTYSGGVISIDSNGQIRSRYGEAADPAGITASAIDLDSAGNLYVATWGRGVLKFAPGGALLTSAGTIAEPGTIPQPGEFRLPNGIATGPNELVWVSDNEGEYSAVTALRVVTPEDVQATVEAETLAQEEAEGTDGEAEAEDPAEELPVEVVDLRQWASSATASSFYGDDYSAEWATGEPTVEECRSSPQEAWAPAAPGTVETLELDFDEPVFATSIAVHQSHQPGAVTEVEVRDTDGSYTRVYTSKSILIDECPFVLTIDFDVTEELVDGVRLTIDQSNAQSWNEIDAVELVGLQPTEE